MKLNKNGWGLSQMLWMSGIILFFFLVVVVLIYNLYNSLDLDMNSKESVDNISYKQMEKDLESAAIEYMEYNYSNFSDTGDIWLTREQLFKAGLFMEYLYEDCEAYTISNKINGNISSKAYIKCEDYVTSGYDN